MARYLIASLLVSSVLAGCGNDGRDPLGLNDDCTLALVPQHAVLARGDSVQLVARLGEHCARGERSIRWAVSPVEGARLSVRSDTSAVVTAVSPGVFVVRAAARKEVNASAATVLEVQRDAR